MPLKIAQGVAIPMPALPLAQPALGGRTLTPTYSKQEQTNWCWAACMQMVISIFEPARAVTQCGFANRAFAQQTCCTNPSSSICNRPLPVNQIATEYAGAGYNATHVSASVAIDVVKAEIGAGRPLKAGLAWSGGGGHAILVVGWDIDAQQNNQVVVLDPWEGRKVIDYSELRTAYGLGQWSWSWTGISR